MFRTELPHASRVVMPASASRRIAGSTSCSGTKCNCTFCRVEMWPNPRECRSATSASTSSCAASRMPCGNLDAQHLGVGVLPLTVGAAQQPELPPFVRRDLAALELAEHHDERIDVGRVGKGQPRAVRTCADRLQAAMIISTGGGRLSCRPRKAVSGSSCVERMPARPATAPTTMMPGRSPSSPGASSAPSVSSVPCHCLGSGPRDAEQHGGRRPRAPIRRRAARWRSRARLAIPISTTMVALPGSSERRTGAIGGFGVTRDDEERGREPAMRDGDSREQRRGNRAGDAGNDLAGNAGRGERQRLFPAASEDERIAALEPDDAMAAARLANHQPVDRVLPNRRTSGALADEEPPRARGVAQRRRSRPARRRARDPLRRGAAPP